MGKIEKILATLITWPFLGIAVGFILGALFGGRGGMLFVGFGLVVGIILGISRSIYLAFRYDASDCTLTENPRRLLINRVFLAFLYVLAIYTVIINVFFSEQKTPSMDTEAYNTVLQYLARNNLPSQELRPYHSSASPQPDYSYLYIGGERCIEFVVYCHGQNCNDLKKYPYDEHGEQCPEISAPVVILRD